MNLRVKPLVALVCGAILMPFLLPSVAQAQSTIVSQGTATLTPFMTTLSSESVTVSYVVVDNTSSRLYTYYYNVNNPVGDVQLQDNSTPENFNSFALTFNATMAGALTSVTMPAGGSYANDGNVVAWTFPDVTPGNSAFIAFQSDFAPGNGNASVSGGATPPSPWASGNSTQQVPVPRAVPEPGTTLLLGLTGLLFLPFSFKLRPLFRRA